MCSIVAPLRAQTSDWRSVEELAPGTPISVVAKFRRGTGRHGCELVRVTDWELVCDRDIGGDIRRLIFAPEKVREVRLEIPEDNRMIRGAFIGGVIGSLLGALAATHAKDPELRGYAPFYGPLIGVFIGGGIGSRVHRHGAVVYRRP